MGIDVLKILELIKDPDLRMKISQLYEENISMKEENHKLRVKLEDNKANEEIKSKIKFQENHYFLDEDGPFCTNCWDTDNKLVRLHKSGPHDGLTTFTCPNCKTITHTGQYIQPNNPGGAGWY